jgi:hypothetical protein
VDQDWLNYQHEIGLRHTRAKQNKTDHADSLDRMHAAFTKSVMLHVTVWTRRYVDAADW